MSRANIVDLIVCLVTAAAVTLPARVAMAQAPDVVPDTSPPPAAPAEEAKADPGWVPHLTVGASLAFGSNRHVVGQQDGETLTLGLKLASGLDYKMDEHDWRSTLDVTEALTLSAGFDSFIKTMDELRFETIYFYKALDWVGPFVRASLQAPIFPGVDVRADRVDYDVDGDGVAPYKDEKDNATGADVAGGDGLIDNTADVFDRKHYRLTDAFQVLTLKQAAGAFVRPYTSPYAEIDIRVGLGAHEIFADGQHAVTGVGDNPDTGRKLVMLKALKSFQLAGGELAASITGAFEEGRITYWAGGEVLLPFYDSLGGMKGKDYGKVVNVALGAKIGFRVVEWASIDYELKVLRQPQLVDDWQVAHTLLVTFGYAFFD